MFSETLILGNLEIKCIYILYNFNIIDSMILNMGSLSQHERNRNQYSVIIIFHDLHYTFDCVMLYYSIRYVGIGFSLVTWRWYVVVQLYNNLLAFQISQMM